MSVVISAVIGLSEDLTSVGCNKISSLNKAAGGKRSLTPLCYQIQLRRRRKPFPLYEAVAFDKSDYNRRLIYFERQLLPSSFICRQLRSIMTFHFFHFAGESRPVSLNEPGAAPPPSPRISWLTLACLLCFTFFCGVKKVFILSWSLWFYRNWNYLTGWEI